MPSPDFVLIRDHFIRCLITRPQPAPAPGLERQIKRVAFLVSEPVATYLLQFMPILLRQLSRATEPERHEQRGQIRGRVDWAATHRARLSQHNDPTLFICRQTRRQYATPENELVVYVLHALQRLIQAVPSCLRIGLFGAPQANQSFAPTEARLAQYLHRLREYQQHVYLRDIPRPDRITSQHLLRAKTSKTEWYGRVAQFYTAHSAFLNEAESMPAPTQIVLPGELSPLGEAALQLAAWLATP
jgi:hypothetical protein